jgi:hypothetical protein
MLESILDNEAAVNAALIRTGNRELQITGMEKKLLLELRTFLQPFQSFTTMVSGRLAHTGYVTLIRHEIQTLCKAIPGESQNMKEIKRLGCQTMTSHDFAVRQF